MGMIGTAKRWRSVRWVLLILTHHHEGNLLPAFDVRIVMLVYLDVDDSMEVSAAAFVVSWLAR